MESKDDVLGIRTWVERMVGTYKSTELLWHRISFFFVLPFVFIFPLHEFEYYYRNDHRNNHSCGKLKISDELNHEELRINRRPISFVWFSSFLLAIARCLSTTPHPINRAGRKYTSCYITLWSVWWPHQLKLNGRSELRSLTFVWFSSNLFDLERKILIKVFQI